MTSKLDKFLSMFAPGEDQPQDQSEQTRLSIERFSLLGSAVGNTLGTLEAYFPGVTMAATKPEQSAATSVPNNVVSLEERRAQIAANAAQVSGGAIEGAAREEQIREAEVAASTQAVYALHESLNQEGTGYERAA